MNHLRTPGAQLAHQTIQPVMKCRCLCFKKPNKVMPRALHIIQAVLAPSYWMPCHPFSIYSTNQNMSTCKIPWRKEEKKPIQNIYKTEKLSALSFPKFPFMSNKQLHPGKGSFGLESLVWLPSMRKGFFSVSTQIFHSHSWLSLEWVNMISTRTLLSKHPKTIQRFIYNPETLLTFLE